MLRHYLLMAARSFTRHKLYSFINVAGLALGLACVIFIIVYIRYETSYDKWVPDSARLYRIELTANIPGRGPFNTALTPFPLAKTMQEEIPGVVAATRLRPEGMTLTVGGRPYFETVDVVDRNFFQVIRLPLQSGDPARVLSQPESLVLSEDTARKFFGDANPLGQTVTVQKTVCLVVSEPCQPIAVALKVTGVLRNLPPNSSLVAHVVIPNTSAADWASQDDRQDWLSANYYGYVVLAMGLAPRAVIAKLGPILDTAMGPAISKRQLRVRGSRLVQVHLTPFADVHLASSGYVQNMTPAGSWITVYGMGVIGVLILLVACFNFTNLATARAMLRAREISLRKCLDAHRGQLVLQFLGESVLTALCSLVLALVLVEILLPVYDGFLGLPISFHYLHDWPLSLMILGIATAAGLVSGSYPALMLSGFRPATVLRTSGAGQTGSGRLRTVLVVLQFSVSIGLGIAAIVVSRQISLARHLDLGFDPNHVVVMRVMTSRREGFAQALRRDPGVLAAVLSNAAPFSPGHPMGLVQLPGRPGTITVSKMMIAPDFPRVYDIPLVAGRPLSASRGVDSLSDDMTPANDGHDILINAAAAAQFGYSPRQAIGKTIIYSRSPVTVVGVLGNAKFNGALEPVRPTVYFYDIDNMYTLSIRLRGRELPATLRFIDRTARAFELDSSAQRYFLSNKVGALYLAYDTEGVMFRIFAGIAIFIACLGLFGLAAFTAGRRTKEIGIRRVFGARVGDVVWLLLWQSSIPVLIANLIAWPLAWYYLHGWLQGFAYRISLNPLYFILSGGIALLIAWATVYANTLRLARANPIHALRYE